MMMCLRFTASGEIDCLLAENTELRLALESGVRSYASDYGSVGSDGDSAVSGDELLLLPGNGGENDATPTGAAAKQQKKREDSKKRMSKQAQKKAKELVQSGHVLTQASISDMTKAEARAYLSAMTGSSANENRSVLLAAVRAAFDERGERHRRFVWPSYFTVTVERSCGFSSLIN